MFTFLTFVCFTALVGALTYWITRKREIASADGYFLAGRSLGAGVIAGSLLLTNLSTEQLVGLNGAAYTDGLCVMAWEVVAGASLVVMAIFFLPRYLSRGIATIPEYLAGRFDGLTRSLTDGIFILAYMLILLPIILYSGAIGLKEILDLRGLTGIESETTLLWLSVWTIGILGSIYAIFGGLRSVAISDTLNGFGLLAGGLLITYLGLQLVGDGDPWGGLRELRATHSDKFRSLGGDSSSVPWHTLFTGVLLLNLFYWTTNQQIIQRAFAAKTLAQGQQGVLLAATFKILAPLILVLPGIIAFHLFSAEPGSAEVKPDQAYGRLVKLVLPESLTGFFAAVMVGAILSSFNSVLNSTATLFSLGVYRNHLHPHASDAQTVRAGKIFGTVIALAAMSTAPLLAGQESLFGYLQKMNGLYFIPIFAVVVMGLTTRHVPAIAANLALILGVGLIAAGYFMPAPARWLAELGIHEFHFLGIVFLFLINLMLAIGILAPRRETDRVIVHTEKEDSALPAIPGANSESLPAAAYRPPIETAPWPWAIPVGLALASIVIGIYVFFAI